MTFLNNINLALLFHHSFIKIHFYYNDVMKNVCCSLRKNIKHIFSDLMLEWNMVWFHGIRPMLNSTGVCLWI